jgi:hypothetical protein
MKIEIVPHPDEIIEVHPDIITNMNMRIKEMNTLDRIMKYESGEGMTSGEVIELFQELVNSGLIFKLQGSYQRTAINLLQMGLITMPEGK